jgi:hypothetical protein
LKLRGLPRWKKVELAQALFGLGILILVISTSIYYYYYVPQIEASKEKIRILKMATGAPYSTATTIVPIKIWVVDESGNHDEKRDDVIEVTLGPAKILELRETRVKLVRGEALIHVYATGTGQENVLLTAVWASGESYLEPASILVIYPPMGSGG